VHVGGGFLTVALRGLIHHLDGLRNLRLCYLRAYVGSKVLVKVRYIAAAGNLDRTGKGGGIEVRFRRSRRLPNASLIVG
jgi:hypothetical protein